MQKVIPAILTANAEELKKQLVSLKDQSNWVHIDIMDGKFVPNTSISLFELGEASQFFHVEIHLMVENPEKYFEDCKGVGAKRVIFHLEASVDPETVLQKMEEHGFQKVVALNPATLPSKLAAYIEKLDAVLLMSVNPGFQGQEFLADVLKKIPEIRKLRQDILIGLDGGINDGNIKRVFQAGADYAGVGSAIMKSPDPVAALQRLEELVKVS